MTNNPVADLVAEMKGHVESARLSGEMPNGLIVRALAALRALPIDAQKALDQMLARAREDGIREAAEVCEDIATGWQLEGMYHSQVEVCKSCRDSIFDLLNDGGRG